jgi:hypothetical protein
VSAPDNPLTELGPGDQSYNSYGFDVAAAWIAGTAALIKSAYPRLAPALVGPSPTVIDAVPHPAAKLAVTAGLVAAGVIALTVALVLAVRRRRPVRAAAAAPAGPAYWPGP